MAIPAFAAFGLADMMWHTILGIETSIDIFFSPSHLGLVVTMMLIITTPLRSAWNAPTSMPGRGSAACCPRCSGSRSPPRSCRCSCRTATPCTTGAAATGGGLPTVPELWTGAPVVAGLIGLALGALFLPNAVTAQRGRGDRT
jgi:hypothetical protein